jgi:hypothetical protein
MIVGFSLLAVLLGIIIILFVKTNFKFDIKNFEIARISFNNTFKEVLDIHGEPLKKELKDGGFEIWTYPGLIVEFSKKEQVYGRSIYQIIVTNNKYKTYRGVKVGDSVNKVYEKYGKIKGWNFDKDKVLLSYYKPMPSFKNMSLTYYIHFEVTNKKVSKIDISLETD